MSCAISQPTCLILPPFLLPSPPPFAGFGPFALQHRRPPSPPSFVSVTYVLRLNDASIYRQSQITACLDPEARSKISVEVRVCATALRTGKDGGTK